MRLLPLFFCLLFFGAYGQIVNIENRRIYEDTSGWSGSVDGGFSAVQNDKPLYSYSLRPRIQYKNRKHYYLLLGDLAYTRGQKTTYANSGMTHFRYAYRLWNSPWKWESYAQVQYNQLLNQKLRTLAGTGLRWKFFDNKKYRGFAGSSFFYEYEILQTDHVTNDGVRWSNYLAWFIDPGKGWSFNGTTYYQPLLSNFNRDFRISGQYQMLFHIYKRIDIKLEYSFYYDSRPPADVRNFVFSTLAGVHIKLGE